MSEDDGRRRRRRGLFEASALSTRSWRARGIVGHGVMHQHPDRPVFLSNFGVVEEVVHGFSFDSAAASLRQIHHRASNKIPAHLQQRLRSR